MYKEAPDDENPVRLQIAARRRRAMFALAEKLDHFKRPLEANLKVANMGMKTFRFEAWCHQERDRNSTSPSIRTRKHCSIGSKAHRIAAPALRPRTDRKVRPASGSTRRCCRLRRRLERKRLVGTERFLPLLDRIAKNEAYLHMARERAAIAGRRIRASETEDHRMKKSLRRSLVLLMFAALGCAAQKSSV